ncbi:hypothetical protein EYF80_040188 [Liparis tanakae]|uniref:Uncharacterized protein n=1 Tax=Liparis tanakae TaxID=230148 RepID=A0A4Z2G8Y3_9TELE|nr:hypothetical protein EYF80_040188 [Liparis tanakae]
MGKHSRRHQGARQICTAGPADQRASRNMKSETVDSHTGNTYWGLQIHPREEVLTSAASGSDG